MTSLSYLKTNKLARHLNPIVRLGLSQYSIRFPILGTASLCLLVELLAHYVFRDPESVGLYAIFVSLATVIYFAFRDGIKGGLIATLINICYYFYIIFSRRYEGEQLIVGVQTTLLLGFFYSLIALIIGWLKQMIDRLIQRETVARLEALEGQVRLRTILQQLPVGVLSLDASTLTLEGNAQAGKILGIKLKSKLSTQDKQTLHQVYRDNQALPSRQWPIFRAIKQGETIIGEEMEYKRKDGKKINLRVSAAPIRQKQKIVGAVSTVFDVTQEKELEKRKDDFVNMASHELKTPITSMKLYVDSLIIRIQKTDDQRSLKIITGIKNQTERLQELVNDLLDMTRIQTGKLNFNKVEFRLDELLLETMEALQETTTKHQIVYHQPKPMTVYGDRFRIYQVFTNLITNAIKYSPTSSQILVKVKKEGNRAVVSVKDSGIGISKAQRKKIFERLYQVHDTTEKTFPGLGMGLYISKEIVKRHKGNIWVEGELNKGSTFYFSIPTKKI